MSKWTNLNICGLIMGAMSTILFADVELDGISFGFGVVSLLSSLISIGFGTGLMSVFGGRCRRDSQENRNTIPHSLCLCTIDPTGLGRCLYCYILSLHWHIRLEYN
ncbi:hypothetical protein B0J17DRAFT_296463 [Rhizoctonia solani]|nr:hypothetical protein B0J17DRAFT_296463 [Rhizoctonia solani]